MKKIMTGILIAAMLGMTACGQNESPAEQPVQDAGTGKTEQGQQNDAAAEPGQSTVHAVITSADVISFVNTAMGLIGTHNAEAETLINSGETRLTFADHTFTAYTSNKHIDVAYHQNPAYNTVVPLGSELPDTNIYADGNGDIVAGNYRFYPTDKKSGQDLFDTIKQTLADLYPIEAETHHNYGEGSDVCNIKFSVGDNCIIVEYRIEENYEDPYEIRFAINDYGEILYGSPLT